MSIAESLAMGCPVLSTDVGNQADIVRQSGGGALFDPASEQSFLQAVRDVTERNEELSRKAREYWLAFLKPEMNYEKLVSIYNDPGLRGRRPGR